MSISGNLDRPRFSGSDLTFEIKKLNDEISGLRQENEELRASNEYLRTAHGVDVHNISQLQLQIKATQELSELMKPFGRRKHGIFRPSLESLESSILQHIKR